MSEQPSARVAVRPLVAGDLPALERCEVALFGASAWSRAMLAEELGGPGRWYVAADLPAWAEAESAGAAWAGAASADRLAGYAGLWFDGDDAHVMTIGVVREHQGRGIGGVLLGALVGRARELGARAMLLEVRVDNAPALALYARFGFARLRRRRGYYQPENVDAWTMRRELRADAPHPDAPAST